VKGEKQMSFREDIGRVLALSNEVSDVRVSEGLRHLADTLSHEEARRKKSDAEIEASDLFINLRDSFLRSGIVDPESARSAARLAYDDLQRLDK